MTVQDIGVAHNIWGNCVTSLKLNITKKKPITIAGYLVQVTEEPMKLHKDIYFTADIFFVNSIPLFITLNREICLTSANHLANRKVETIFKAFKYIFSHYMKHVFQITTLHADEEFPPTQAMIYGHMPEGPMINLTSENEHVLDIEHKIIIVKERTRAVRH